MKIYSINGAYPICYNQNKTTKIAFGHYLDDIVSTKESKRDRLNSEISELNSRISRLESGYDSDYYDIDSDIERAENQLRSAEYYTDQLKNKIADKKN